VAPQEVRGVARADVRISPIVQRFSVEQVDALVYELYGLTEEEIAIVEWRDS
jgi:hypothetical protein